MGGLRGCKYWPLVLPPSCGVYDGADYTTFILQKTRFCARYMCVRVICVRGYMRENTLLNAGKARHFKFCVLIDAQEY